MCFLYLQWDPLTVPVLIFCAFTPCFVCPDVVTPGGCCDIYDIAGDLSELFVGWSLFASFSFVRLECSCLGVFTAAYIQ